MQSDIDQKILGLYIKGMHQDALSLLMSTYQSRLYWHIRRILISHEDTDDALQNTFIKAWKGLENFKGDSKLFTWLFRIASNETFTFIEKNKKNSKNDSLEDSLELSGGDLSDSLNGDEIQLKLEQAIATLPERQRMTFHLKYFEDLKYEEISVIMGTSIGSLKANYHLATKKIEEFLKSH